MKITCGPAWNVKPSQQINSLGQYLYDTMDGAFKIEKHPNSCDVYFKLLYEVPRLQRIPGKQKEGYNDVHEIVIDVNLATYQNKIRMDIIEVTPNAKTLGFDLFEPEKMKDLKVARSLIWSTLNKRVSKAYQQYDFIF